MVAVAAFCIGDHRGKSRVGVVFRAQVDGTDTVTLIFFEYERSKWAGANGGGEVGFAAQKGKRGRGIGGWAADQHVKAIGLALGIFFRKLIHKKLQVDGEQA